MSGEKEKSRDKSKVHKLSLKGNSRSRGKGAKSDMFTGSSKLIAEFVRNQIEIVNNSDH